MGNGASKFEWRHAPKAHGGFGEILKKSVELSPVSEKHSWLSLARGGLGQVSHRMGGRWKSKYRKIEPLSPDIEKPLNSKVIKSFVPELRSRKCFSCFEIPIFYVYIYIYMNMLCPFLTYPWLWYIYIYIYIISFWRTRCCKYEAF